MPPPAMRANDVVVLRRLLLVDGKRLNSEMNAKRGDIAREETHVIIKSRSHCDRAEIKSQSNGNRPKTFKDSSANRNKTETAKPDYSAKMHDPKPIESSFGPIKLSSGKEQDSEQKRNAQRNPLAKFWFIALVAVAGLRWIPASEMSPQAGSLPVSWMTQVAAASGQTPKLNTAPLVQLDTGNKYYKTMIEGMIYNFKRAVSRASEQLAGSMSNATSNKPISVIGTAPGNNQNQRVTIEELKIDGLNNPKVATVYVNKKNMKLHVVFTFKSIRVFGKCVAGPKKADNAPHSARVILEATNWNTSWSASVMQMIGREHFDMSRVYSSHSQHKLNVNLKDCAQALHEKLRVALIDRVKSSIDNRLIDIMETVIIRTDTLVDDGASTDNTPVPSRSVGRGKRDSGVKSTKPGKQRKLKAAEKGRSRKANPFVGSPSPTYGRKQKVLKRTKRQTPCQQGEELDDYVDQLFRFGTRIVRAMEPITLPNATVELPDYNLKIFLYEGKGTRIYKFRRTKPAWVYCSNETISLGVTIEVEEMRVAYKYRVISGTRLLFDGDMEAKLSPKVQAQFSQAVQEEDSEEPVQQRIDRVRLFRLGRVHVVIRGLGNLTQSLSMIINSYLNDNQEQLQPTFRMAEGDAVRMLNRFLANVNVPLLSVV